LNPTLLGQWLERRRKITGEVTVTWCDGVMLGARAFSQARPFGLAGCTHHYVGNIIITSI
jgi:hypothetical protein